jgi:hypothetical protein
MKFINLFPEIKPYVQEVIKKEEEKRNSYENILGSSS